MEYAVVVVGAGPAGLALAADLGRRGQKCLLIERRTKVTRHPRATLLGSRSMEFYRQLGIADEILAANLPQKSPGSRSIIIGVRSSIRPSHKGCQPAP